MKYIRSVMCQLKGIVFSLPFLFCVMVSAILMFTASFYLDSNNSMLSVLESFLRVSKEELLSTPGYSSAMAMKSGLYGWFSLMVPVVAGLPFATRFRDERSTGFSRIYITKTGRGGYFFSEGVSCILSGGLVVSLGWLIYGAIVSVMFPSFGSYDVYMVKELFGTTSMINWCGKVLVNAFLYGCVWSMVSFALVGFVNNKYLVIGIPFMLKYIWGQWINVFGEKWQSYSPNSMLDLFTKGADNFSILLLGALIIVGGASIFYYSMSIRRDQGV